MSVAWRRTRHPDELPLCLENLFDMAPDALLVIDRDGTIVVANRQAGELFGWPRAELLGLPIAQLVPESSRVRHNWLQRRFHVRLDPQLAKPLLGSMRAIRRDGQAFPAQITLSPLSSGMLIAAVHDCAQTQAQLCKILSLNRMYRTLVETNQFIECCESEAQLFNGVCEVAVRFGELHLAWIGRLEPGGLEFRTVAHKGCSLAVERDLNDLHTHVDAGRAQGRGPAAVAWREARAVYVQNFREDPCVAPWGAADDAVKGGSCAALPLRRGGKMYAVLMLYDSQPATFSSEVRDLLERMTLDIETALDRIALHGEKERAAEQLRIAALAFESSGAMLVMDGDGRVLRANAVLQQMSGYGSSELYGRELTVLCAHSRPMPALADMLARVREQGCWQGEIWARRKCGEEFPLWLSLTGVTDGSGAWPHYVASVTDLSDQKNTEQRISTLLNFDALTGLPNRRFMLDRLRSAVQWAEHVGGRGAALLIGLDRFQAINDMLGHPTGDLVLQQSAERVRREVPGDDLVGRVGADEFLVVLEDLGGDAEHAPAEAVKAAERLAQIILQPHLISGQMVSCSASIGIAPWDGAGSAGFHELLRRADVALQAAKDAGRNTVRLFCADMQRALERRVHLESRLHGEFSTSQLQLYYQRRVDLHGRTLGAEALLRWHDPQHGVVSPLELVSAAEETGLIHDIGRWTLSSVCNQLKTWSQCEGLAQRLKVAVNVSPRQLTAEGFVEEVTEIVSEAGIDPHLLELELTEPLSVQDTDNVIPKMNALCELGIAFAVDDVGIGCSSLEYLRHLPIDVLKIDRSFVSGMSRPGGETLVQTIVRMGRCLGLEVVAEGVENDWQWRTLLEQGCDRYQGYLFGRPLPIEEFNRELVTSAG